MFAWEEKLKSDVHKVIGRMRDMTYHTLICLCLRIETWFCQDLSTESIYITKIELWTYVRFVRYH